MNNHYYGYATTNTIATHNVHTCVYKRTQTIPYLVFRTLLTIVSFIDTMKPINLLHKPRLMCNISVRPSLVRCKN